MPTRTAHDQKNFPPDRHNSSLTPREADLSAHSASQIDGGKVADTTAYIAQLCSEMVQLAQSVEQNTLAYFLAMAQEEAEQIALDQRHKR